MRRLVVATACVMLACAAVHSGVVITMESRGSGTSDEPGIDTIYAEGESLRLDPHPSRGGDMSMIFRDDTLWVVDHKKKACQKMDRDGMEELSGRMNEAMAEMEAEMAKLPPEQRAMMEEMMKKRMGRGSPSMGEQATERRSEIGATETIGEYDCTVQTMYAGDAVVAEICAADEGVVAGGQEAMTAFRAMAKFSQELMDAVQQGPLAMMVDTPLRNLDEVAGFPIRIRTYVDGRLTDESTLRSIEPQDLEDDVFTVPDNYKVRDLQDELKGRR